MDELTPLQEFNNTYAELVREQEERVMDTVLRIAGLGAMPIHAEAAVAAVVEGEDFVTDPTLARQSAIPLQIPESAALVGVGGVGSWVGYFLALAGMPHLSLFDDDTVSASNLNRLPYGPEGLDMPKTEALKAFIAKVRPQCQVDCYPAFSAKFATALDLSCAWMVVSTDTWASRKDAYRWSMDGLGHAYCAYIEAAAEGEVGSIAGSPADWCTPEEDNPGYASVPVWVGPCVAAAMMAVSHVLHGRSPSTELAIRMGWDENLRHASYTVSDRK